MGLDMYLTRKTYVQNWEHMKPEERHEITVLKGGVVRADIKPERVSYIIEEVAYWRKANQIHRWFVDHCQDGVDDCRNAYVSEKQLQELVDLCKQVLNSVELVDGSVHNGTSFTFDEEGPKQTELYEEGQIIAQPQIAESLLPAQPGFFFGSTDYDQYYINDLKNTVKMLEPLLADGSSGDYYYQSSW